MSSQESVTTQLSIPSTPREESILEYYFQLLSQASFDKAKELVDSEKGGHKFSSAANWGETLQCLSQLASAEKSYHNLVFLSHKRFSNIVKSKDGAKSIYSLLHQEFLRMENMMLGGATGGKSKEEEPSDFDAADDVDRWLAHISGQMAFFVRGRIKMIEFYEQLSSLVGMRQSVSFEDLVMMCEEIMKENIKKFHHPLLSPIRTVFSYECESLCHLMQAQILMSTWSYLPCVLQLHEAHAKLNSWAGLIPNKEVKSAFGARSSKTQHFPPLHSWLTKFKAILLSKFGLYFFDILSKQTVPSLLKANLSKTSEDFVGKIHTFQKKSDAFCVYLVLESQGLHGRVSDGGYHHPKKYSVKPQGMETYPPIFAYPVDRVVNPVHWPNIVMMINSTPDQGEKLKVFYDKATDKRPHISYFIIRADPHVWLVSIFESKKSEKDSAVNSFMTELAMQLRCHTVLASLKSFAKS